LHRLDEPSLLKVVEEDVASGQGGDGSGLMTKGRFGHKSAALQFVTGLMVRQYQGHLFLTRSGWLGIAWGEIQAGDELVVFDWAPAPFVLRRAAERTDSAYRLVAQAFASGLMDGEAYQLGVERTAVPIM
jgi:hypothetical protein